MFLESHGEIECLNGFHDGLKIWCIHLTTNVVHINGVAETQSTIVRGREPAVPFDAVVLAEVVRDEKMIIRTLTAIGIATIVVKSVIAHPLCCFKRVG